MKVKIGHNLYLLIFFASIIFIATIWLRSDIKSLQSFDAYDKLHQAYSIAHNNLQSETLVYTGSDFDADHRFAFLSDVTMIKLPDGRRVSAFPIAFAITGLPFAFLNSIVPGSFDFSPLVSLIPLIIMNRTGFFGHPIRPLS